jgi:hypothetical protein
VYQLAVHADRYAVATGCSGTGNPSVTEHDYRRRPVQMID